MQLVHQIMAFSDSDDELLEPTFLQKKTINQVLTSSKAVYQDELTLSPQTLTPPSCVSKKKKSHFSLMGLLAEKNNLCVKSETDEKIDEMRKKFEEGDFTRLVEETDNIESETIHHSQETSLENQTQNLNEHDKQLLKKVTSFLENDFPDTFPGEEVFVHEVKEELIQDMTPFFSCFDEDLDGVNDEVIKIALLTFIIDESTSDDVCQLLWRLICLHKDDVVSKLAYDVLLDSIENKRKSWFPKAADFFGFLVNLGADAIKLVPSSVSLNKFCTIPMQPEELEFTETSSIRERFFARCSNLILLLRLYTFCIQKKLVTLCADEIDCLVLVALRLCLDKVVQLAVWDLEVLIGSLLDSYNQWDKDQVLPFETFFQLNHDG